MKVAKWILGGYAILCWVAAAGAGIVVYQSARPSMMGFVIVPAVAGVLLTVAWSALMLGDRRRRRDQGAAR